ncbi:thioredoxin domain-containing protein [Sphingomonas sp. BIUV-7]|uniref:Thioredoxin domain-containing protein n=1 Tax=Sphingomonas natans TaxID=3063330 RepID=A0ABT8YET3_9SPHN|nr:thioredoxin domain-containing protein [Sphingomonas sp. BIUV-7]MDO6416872.1 thioredoxin domain-containing protein [Sphingomonas sp. BIUV-7]
MKQLVRRLLPLLILAFACPAFAPASAATPVAAKDWTKVATRTPAGTFVQGNPDAKVKLVEYLSFTCPHCAAFEKEGAAPLAERYIRTGLVSYEVRIALRDPFDLVAAVLARCSGPQAFFAVKPALFAAQPDWLGKGEKWGATSPKLDQMSEADAGKAIAAGSGLDAFFLKHGLPRARIDACIANVADQRLLSSAAQAIWTPDFPGTPLFVINGTRAEGVHDWAGLDAKLKAALG